MQIDNCRITTLYYVKVMLLVSTFSDHHLPLQENKTKVFNCLNTDPYYDFPLSL
jgi:hypothetical protein